MHQVRVRPARWSPVAWFVAVVGLCGVVDVTLGLGLLGWMAGTVTGVVLAIVLARRGAAGLTAADQITAARAALAGGVTALVAQGLVGKDHVLALSLTAGVALVLDLVDGYVARRTHTESAFGARFDMEVDAFLIAVLSVQVATGFGWWVLLIGAMRYLYVAAGHVWLWLQLPLPPRRSAKVVAAVQGVTLAVAASELLPHTLIELALAVALLLLVESFGRDCWTQWRRRDEMVTSESAPSAPSTRATLATVLAGVILWSALVQPRLVGGPVWSDLVRIPVEGLVLLAVSLALPASARRLVAVIAGMGFALAVLLHVTKLGFEFVLGRDFHLIGDWPNLVRGYQVVRDTEGMTTAVVAVTLVAVAVAAVVIGVLWSSLRMTRVASRHRRRTWVVLAALAVVWSTCFVAGSPVRQVAAASTVGLVKNTVDQVHADQRAQIDFGDELQTDAFAGRSGKELVGALHGKDVLFIWFESYGRTALEGPVSPGVQKVVAASNRKLAKAGYTERSAFLTSPVVGAGSWLAHGSTQSGVWVDEEARYDQLLASHRLSLTRAFARAGRRTVFVVPANTVDWPQGAKYYGFDKLYDARNVGYRGPKFGYASMPDQYTLEHFRRTELAKPHRRRVFAEIDLVSSHYRWGKLPDLVPWKKVGDGSVFDGMDTRGDAIDGRLDPKISAVSYGRSVEYTWRAIVSFLTTYPDPNRVVIVAGDHQPHPFVGGVGANRDAPVSIIAQDPAVIRRIRGWHWQPGLWPKPDAPVWRMDAFRNKFFEAYGTGRLVQQIH